MKRELQTSKGLIALLRKELIPDSKTMARLALEKVESELKVNLDETYVRENFNSLLIQLIQAETAIFDKRQACIFI